MLFLEDADRIPHAAAGVPAPIRRTGDLAGPPGPAALLGLAFVAISFNLDAILRYKTLPGRAIETLVFFAYPLAASLLLQVPGLSSTALGIGEPILAAVLIGLAATIDVPRWRRERDDPLR